MNYSSIPFHTALTNCVEKILIFLFLFGVGFEFQDMGILINLNI